MLENEHKEHRKRLRNRFVSEAGFEEFEDHVILEMMLFYSIPQIDTNPIAHRLINEFGSLHKVLDAPLKDLMKISGVSYNTAVFLNSLVPLMKAYETDKYKHNSVVLDSTEATLNFFKEKYRGFSEETFSVVGLDSRNRVLFFDVIAKGSIDMVITDNRETMRRLIENKAICAIVCHNHPSSVGVPSESDENITRGLVALMKSFGVRLIDHVIVGNDGDAFSMKDSAFFCKLFEIKTDDKKDLKKE